MSSHIPSNTKIDVYELCKNGKSIFEEFFKQIEDEGNLISNLAAAIRIVEDSANLKMAPKKSLEFYKDFQLNVKSLKQSQEQLEFICFMKKKLVELL